MIDTTITVEIDGKTYVGEIMQQATAWFDSKVKPAILAMAAQSGATVEFG